MKGTAAATLLGLGAVLYAAAYALIERMRRREVPFRDDEGTED